MKSTGTPAIQENRTMYRRLLAMLALSTLVSSTLAGCGSSHPTLTILSIAEGDVFVMKAGADDWTEASVGTTLEVGDIVRTGDDSGAEIAFADGSVVELQAGTEIEVVSLDVHRDSGSTAIVLKQTIGTVIFRVTRLIDPASRYEVETPTGVVAVRGSAVEVSVLEDGTTLGCSLEGDIWAVAHAVELQIPEGQCFVMGPGQQPRLVFDLTVSSTVGGSVVVPGEETFPYEEGTVVELLAEAQEGYVFVEWTGDIATIANVNTPSTTITMDASYSITANFIRHYTLTISSWGGGSVWSPGEGQFTYAAGAAVDLLAISDPCYSFSVWAGDVDTIGNVLDSITTIVMNGDYSITASFVQDPDPYCW